MRAAIATVAVMLFSTTAVSQEQKDEYWTDNTGFRLHLKIYLPKNVESRSPTIVLESGGGFDAGQWEMLQPKLADEFHAIVVAYDRPGFGNSDLPDAPYDIKVEVRNLHSALEQFGVAEHTVVVAHSYGALLAQLYASLWPHNVSGLVFLDPNSPATMIALHELQTRPAQRAPQTQRERALARIDAAVWDTFTAVYRSPIPKQIPLVVVSAEQGVFPEEKQNEAFRLTHQLLALSVTDGKRIVAEGSNHMIPAQRPDVVISSVREIFNRIAM